MCHRGPCRECHRGPCPSFLTPTGDFPGKPGTVCIHMHVPTCTVVLKHIREAADPEDPGSAGLARSHSQRAQACRPAFPSDLGQAQASGSHFSGL